MDKPAPEPARPDRTAVIFADFACPFSYVMETLLRREAGDEWAVEARAFELHPHPAPLPAAALDDSALAPLLPLAREAGIRFGTPALATRTSKAHEAASFARDRGREGALREEIYRAYWAAGEDIGRIDVLCRMADGIGLDGEELRIVLDIDTHAPHVAADRDAAWKLGVRQTPTLFLGVPGDAPYMVGAHPPEEIREMLAAAARPSGEPG